MASVAPPSSLIEAVARPGRFALLAAVVSLGLIVSAVGGSPAAAQGFGWFGNLFNGGQQRYAPRAQPSFPGFGRQPQEASPQPDVYEAPPRPRPRRHRVVEQPPREKAPPKNASLFVDVFGDSLGQMLAIGLDDALSDRQDVAVVHKARGSSGLAATDFYDWPKAINDLLDHDKPGGGKAADAGRRSGAKDHQDDAGHKPERIDVAVMMIGTNDRQPIKQDGKTLAFGTADWTAVYKARVEAIADAFRKKGIPLVWVGVPITKSDDFADDMAALNDIYRDVAAKDGATYVDTWEAFSDDNGDFSSYGPDINGQTVRLRSSDGIHFTRAGARKLAHFVEVHIRRALDGKAAPADAPATDKGASTVAATKPDVGPIRSLNEAPKSKDGSLATTEMAKALLAKDPTLERVLLDGHAQAPPAGRADDLSWPKDAPPAGPPSTDATQKTATPGAP